MTEFKDALNKVEWGENVLQAVIGKENIEAIIRALRIADKLMQSKRIVPVWIEFGSLNSACNEKSRQCAVGRDERQKHPSADRSQTLVEEARCSGRPV